MEKKKGPSYDWGLMIDTYCSQFPIMVKNVGNQMHRILVLLWEETRVSFLMMHSRALEKLGTVFWKPDVNRVAKSWTTSEEGLCGLSFEHFFFHSDCGFALFS